MASIDLVQTQLVAALRHLDYCIQHLTEAHLTSLTVTIAAREIGVDLTKIRTAEQGIVQLLILARALKDEIDTNRKTWNEARNSGWS